MVASYTKLEDPQTSAKEKPQILIFTTYTKGI